METSFEMISCTVTPEVRESGLRVMQAVLNKEYKEQQLTNDVIPFEKKEYSYMLGFSRMLNCKNFRYMLECEGAKGSNIPTS